MTVNPTPDMVDGYRQAQADEWAHYLAKLATNETRRAAPLIAELETIKSRFGPVWAVYASALLERRPRRYDDQFIYDHTIIDDPAIREWRRQLVEDIEGQLAATKVVDA